MAQLVAAMTHHLADLAGNALARPLADLLQSYPQPLLESMAAGCTQGGVVGLFSKYLHQVSQVGLPAAWQPCKIGCHTGWHGLMVGDSEKHSMARRPAQLKHSSTGAQRDPRRQEHTAWRSCWRFRELVDIARLYQG